MANPNDVEDVGVVVVDDDQFFEMLASPKRQRDDSSWVGTKSLDPPPELIVFRDRTCKEFLRHHHQMYLRWSGAPVQIGPLVA